MTDESGPRRDEQAVTKFVERFAADLTDNGFPRMPARVFALLLATDAGQLTAAELAQQLQVSAAAISGAVRYLVLINFATRAREGGSRRDVVRVHEHAWLESTSRDQIFSRLESSMQEGLAALGEGTPAGERVAETMGFFAYLRVELPQVLARWKQLPVAGRARYATGPADAGQDRHS
ncbi:MAG TPA: MarR family transcriptional regulator [Pseudonocardiaceae bacterium]|nr:MarR family transcriptional regulator [Pseudonocardiaceae bacterium]